MVTIIFVVLAVIAAFLAVIYGSLVYAAIAVLLILVAAALSGRLRV